MIAINTKNPVTCLEFRYIELKQNRNSDIIAVIKQNQS